MNCPIQVVPFASTLGCIPVGFIYSIKLKVTNTSPYPEKLKISCEQPDDEPNEIKHRYMPVSLAPGISKIIQLELHATVEKTSTYEVVILQESMQTLVKVVKLFVMDPQQYKSVSNSLSAVNKRPYEDCVTIVGKTPPKDETSLINKSQTFSTALIGDDEMEELCTMPLVGSVYWDPQAQQLRVDSELSKVLVDRGSSVDLSISRTEAHREKRLDELESIGMITCNAVSDQVLPSRSAMLLY